MTGAMAAKWLRQRADSYWQDAEWFAEEDDRIHKAMYQTLAEELRLCAKEIEDR